MDAKIVGRTEIAGETGDRNTIYIIYQFTAKISESLQKIRFKLPSFLYLRNIKIKSASPNFSIFLSSKEGQDISNQFYTKSGIDCFWSEYLTLRVVNEDPPQQPYVYGVVTNESETPIGVLWISFTVAQG